MLLGGRYQVGDLVGRGGMGEVFRATDQTTGETVALKALKPGLASSEVMTRFTREGEALRRLNHPNIVKCLGSFQEDGRQYLVMEYMAGGSLRGQLKASGPVQVARVVELSLDLCDALTRAHRLSIIHRDLKPDNVLLGDDAGARLTDFGVAHFGGETHLTGDGAVIGTLSYLSPQACLGHPASPGQDIWALGVMLFELLSGQVPFWGPNPGALLNAVMTQPTPDLQALRPGLPEALVDLVYRMLDKDPSTRINSIREIGLELERLELTGSDSGVVLRPQSDQASGTESLAGALKLPDQATPFIGRRPQLEELDRMLGQGARLVTLLGPGGMGKSRLAAQVAAAQAGRFAHGVHWVELAPLAAPELILPALAESLAMSFVGPLPPEQQLLNHLHDLQLLLVLDNFEHLLEGAALVGRLVRSCPCLVVLITSRSRLNLQAESLFEVEELTYPKDLNHPSLEDFEAVQLFLGVARRTAPGYRWQPEEAPHVARICQLVQGMPLGLELAAAWVRLLSPAEIADELEQSLSLLESQSRDVSERHRSARAAFEYSWQLLSQTERQTLQELSLFRGGFTREAAREVTRAALPVLLSLVDRSLLRRRPSGRFEVHELIRQFAEERLGAQAESLRESFATYYLGMLAQTGQLMRRGRHMDAIMARLHPELENFRSAWRWACSRGRWQLLSEACLTFCSYMDNRTALGGEMEGLLAPALECVRSLPAGPSENSARARLWFSQAALLLRMGRGEGHALLDRAVELFEEGEERALALVYRAMMAQITGSAELQLSFTEAAVARLRESKNRPGLALGTVVLGTQAFESGQTERGRALMQEGLELSEGDSVGRGRHLGAWGKLEFRVGQYARARELTLAALELARSSGDRFFELSNLAQLGGIELTLGQLASAREHYRSALGGAWKDQLIPLVMHVLAGLGQLLALEGEVEEARLVVASIAGHPALFHSASQDTARLLAELGPSPRPGLELPLLVERMLGQDNREDGQTLGA